ncbi:MAG: ABC transporter ATP-binding protein, partial [Symbiobacteriaceae bacterium]|nr:ABC transporter ATP-binding protein [Symbiobacteriaceae bacterium]
MIRRFIAFYGPHRYLFLADMLAVIFMAGADLVYPLIVREIINDYVPNGNIRLFVIWGIALLVIYLIKAGLNYFMEFYGHQVGLRMQADMRKQLFSHLQKLPLAYYDEHKAGDLMSRLVNDLNELAELAHHGPENVLLGSVTLVGSFIILSGINLPLTVMIFATLPLVILFALGMQKIMDEVSIRTREELSEINSDLENALAGIRVTKAFNNSAFENSKFASQIGNFVAASARRYKVMGSLSSGIRFFTDFLYLVVMVAGGYFFLQGEIGVGEFTMFLLYINTFLNPIYSFWSFFERLQSGMTGFRRVLEIMDL